MAGFKLVCGYATPPPCFLSTAGRMKALTGLYLSIAKSPLQWESAVSLKTHKYWTSMATHAKMKANVASLQNELTGNCLQQELHNYNILMLCLQLVELYLKTQLLSLLSGVHTGSGPSLIRSKLISLAARPKITTILIKKKSFGDRNKHLHSDQRNVAMNQCVQL